MQARLRLLILSPIHACKFPINYSIITEIQKKFNISIGALYNLIKRNNIGKFSQGKFTYVAKKDIEAFIKIKL